MQPSSPLTLLIVGGGGREHALAWALSRSPHAERLYIAPGNAGTAQHGQNVPIAADDITSLVAFAQRVRVDLVVVGPEVPLALGLVDALARVGIPAFGPSRKAAQIEASKGYAKDFMRAQGIPTADYARFSDLDAAVAYVESLTDAAVVVKADGLAAGKGVFVCDTHAEAIDALHRLIQGEAFGNAGGSVVVEQRISGPEVSVLAFCDGAHFALMPPARDHKRAYDGDQGPNTGGMGAFAPPSDLPPGLMDLVAQQVIAPTLAGLNAAGTPFVGVLYAGLMLTEAGPMVLEFNARFGDPETQALLPLLEGDLLAVLLACVGGTLDPEAVRWKDGACAAVVAASEGYPGGYAKGRVITGLDALPEGVQVFHAGTARDDDGTLRTAGGRVLAVSAVGEDLDAALERAYVGIRALHFEGMHYRRDVGRPVA